MNSIIEHELPGMYKLRDNLLDILTDEDLLYQLPYNLTLGALCEEMGRFQQIYTLSFKTLAMDWHYQGSLPAVRGSVASLRDWYQQLDADLLEILSTYSDEELQSKKIDRGHDFILPAMVHFEIYHEAVLIFYAKASIYMKALQKPFSAMWKSWIG